MLGKEAICDYPVRMRFVHSQPPGFQYCQKSSHHFDLRKPRHALAEQRGSFVRVRRRSIMKPSKPTGDQKGGGEVGTDPRSPETMTADDAPELMNELFVRNLRSPPIRPPQPSSASSASSSSSFSSSLLSTYAPTSEENDEKEHSSWRVGSRVLCRWHGSTQVWKRARIMVIRDRPPTCEGAALKWYDVQYDKEDITAKMSYPECERGVPGDWLKADPDARPLEPGTRVEVRYRGRRQWFPATIIGLSAHQPHVTSKRNKDSSSSLHGVERIISQNSERENGSLCSNDEQHDIVSLLSCSDVDIKADRDPAATNEITRNSRPCSPSSAISISADDQVAVPSDPSISTRDVVVSTTYGLSDDHRTHHLPNLHSQAAYVEAGLRAEFVSDDPMHQAALAENENNMLIASGFADGVPYAIGGGDYAVFDSLCDDADALCYDVCYEDDRRRELLVPRHLIRRIASSHDDKSKSRRRQGVRGATPLGMASPPNARQAKAFHKAISHNNRKVDGSCNRANYSLTVDRALALVPDQLKDVGTECIVDLKSNQVSETSAEMPKPSSLIESAKPRVAKEHVREITPSALQSLGAGIYSPLSLQDGQTPSRHSSRRRVKVVAQPAAGIFRSETVPKSPEMYCSDNNWVASPQKRNGLSSSPSEYAKKNTSTLPEAHVPSMVRHKCMEHVLHSAYHPPSLAERKSRRDFDRKQSARVRAMLCLARDCDSSAGLRRLRRTDREREGFARPLQGVRYDRSHTLDKNRNSKARQHASFSGHKKEAHENQQQSRGRRQQTTIRVSIGAEHSRPTFFEELQPRLNHRPLTSVDNDMMSTGSSVCLSLTAPATPPHATYNHP